MKKFFKVLPSTNSPASKTLSSKARTLPTEKKGNVAMSDDIFDADFISLEEEQNNKHHDKIVVSDEEDNTETDRRGELVWAKLQGFPWWPALICDDPDSHRYSRTNKQGIPKTHVQFFDNPPTRAWVPDSYCKDYTGSTRDTKYTEDNAEQKAACLEANQYLSKSSEERAELLLVTSQHDKENKGGGGGERDEKSGGEIVEKNKDDGKRKNIVSDNEEEGEEEMVQPKKKAKKTNTIQSDSDSDYVPGGEDADKEEMSPAKKPKLMSPKTPKPSASLVPPRNTTVTPRNTSVTPRTPASAIASKAAANLSKFSRSSTDATQGESSQYIHHTLQWLKPNKIQDKERRPMSDEQYNSKTLHIPPDFLQRCTPGMRQWWQLKVDYFDLILFFKVGKFYELYHMDAEIAVKELGLVFMKGNYAHCGFPEKAFGRYSETLVQKGYRVARIEQTSRPDPKAKTKTVNREVCAVITKGTKTHSYLEGQSPEVQNCYLMCISEQDDEYGVCLIDTSVGVFILAQFSDDRHSSKLRTLISHHNIVQVLYTRRDISEKLQNVLKMELGQALHEPLAKDRELWSASKTLKELATGNYFVDEGGSEASWPEAFSEMTVGEAGSFNAEVREEYQLALSALGGTIFYLTSCLIERPLLLLKQFQIFQPEQFHVKSSGSFPKPEQKLVLDNTAIANLEIFETGEGKQDGSLLSILDKCVTAAGKRLLRKWVCAPLCHPDAINRRLDAIENLLTYPGKVAQVQQALKKVPDLERLLRKIHTLGLKPPKDHPDSRAVLYETEFYGRKMIQNLVNALDGFGKLMSMLDLFSDVEMTITSGLLREVARIDGDNGFPDLNELLEFYQGCFNREEALKSGIILPSKGVNEEYDRALSDIANIEHTFEDLLRKYKAKLQCNITFFGTAKNRFQAEIPNSAKLRVPASWEVQSQRKGFVRYYFPEAPQLKKELFDAEIRKEESIKDTMRLLFQRFSKHYDMWSKAVRCSAVIDVLLSLAQYSTSHETVRPELVTSDLPYLEIEDGNHPILLPTFTPGDFIPNHTTLGNKEKLCLVVTGPNMGGKSTLMRQVGLLVILAQIGCRVPAKRMSFSPTDRIFTRLGASDNITKGESTFFVELSETSTILKHASHHSLVLLDELGRGTATYDGTAIASSVIQSVSQDIQCRTLFSTHYHRLVDELGEGEHVTLGHMSCMNNNEDDEQDITFLYKLSSGACPKSFGFNAARLAGIPESVITDAQKIAKQFESLSDKFHVFGKLLQSDADLDSLCGKLNTLLSS